MQIAPFSEEACANVPSVKQVLLKCCDNTNLSMKKKVVLVAVTADAANNDAAVSADTFLSYEDTVVWGQSNEEAGRKAQLEVETTDRSKDKVRRFGEKLTKLQSQ